MAALWDLQNALDWLVRPCGIPGDYLPELGVTSRANLSSARCLSTRRSRNSPDWRDLPAEAVRQDTPSDSISRRAGDQDEMWLMVAPCSSWLLLARSCLLVSASGSSCLLPFSSGCSWWVLLAAAVLLLKASGCSCAPGGPYLIMVAPGSFGLLLAMPDCF